jgi:uracil-DNA glycosylase
MLVAVALQQQLKLRWGSKFEKNKAFMLWACLSESHEGNTTRPCEFVKCPDFPCPDVNKNRYVIPDVEVNPDKIRAIMIAEAPSSETTDDFYAQGKPFYAETTMQAFNDAGFHVSSIEDVLSQGVYLTTAIKCAKTTYAVAPKTIDNCSTRILEQEISLFPKIKTALLMGDTAIRALNDIAQRNTGRRIIPSGSTYKIRKNTYYYKQLRVFPSYLQTGKSYLIEKSKRKMIAEDIRTALKHH